MPEPSLLAELLRLSPEERKAIIDQTSQEDCIKLLYDWPLWARPNQLPPAGDWRVWLMLAGRGFGKTRSGAEMVRSWVEAGHRRIALVAPTASDYRHVMVEGESGILAVSPPWDRPDYEPSKRLLTWRNGAIATTYSADEPERLRGPQHEAAWCDELASWRYPDAWDQLMFGLRLGDNPRCVVTTTPKPSRIIRELLNDPKVVVTRGRTSENRANLAPAFLDQIVRRYEGTRLGRQELDAELLEDVPGALWTRDMIEAARVSLTGGVSLTDLVRIVVAIDPAVTSGEDSDETGIIVAGKDAAGRGYVLDDLSGRMHVREWARKAVEAYRHHQADRIIAEVNNGGDMVEATIRIADENVAFSKVTATRGKVVRAEPVAALYEKGLVTHVGLFPRLEDQMCFPAGILVETRAGQVPIERVAVGDLVRTRYGYRPVKVSEETGNAAEFVVIETTDGNKVRCTPNHPIYATDRFVSAKSVFPGMRLSVSPNWASTACRWRGEVGGITGWLQATTATLRGIFSIGRFGKSILDRFLRAFMSTMWTKTQETISSTTYGLCPQPSITQSMGRAGFGSWTMTPDQLTLARRGEPANGMALRVCGAGRSEPHLIGIIASSAMIPAACIMRLCRKWLKRYAHTAAPSSGRETQGGYIAVQHVTTQLMLAAEKVYNLQVDGVPEYYANGILVHNCLFTSDFDRTAAGFSPDRVDALVWALSSLLVQPMSNEGIYEHYRQLAEVTKAAATTLH